MSTLEDSNDFREISRGLRKVDLPKRFDYHYALLRHFGEQDNIARATFLDAGSGIGNPLQDFVRNYGAEVISLDINSEVIGELSSSEATATQGDLFTIPFARGSFDGVLSSEVVDIVPKTPEQLLGLFQEINRVLKPNGLFLQRHIGAGIAKEIHKVELQLDTLARAGFDHIRLLGRPSSSVELSFSARSTKSSQRLEDVLESKLKWVYRRAGRYNNGYGTPWDYFYTINQYPEKALPREREGLKHRDKKETSIMFADALKKEKPLLLLKAIRSLILHFYPESGDKNEAINVAADFDFHFVQIYPQFIDEDYCIENSLDPAPIPIYRTKFRPFSVRSFFA